MNKNTSTRLKNLWHIECCCAKLPNKIDPHNKATWFSLFVGTPPLIVWGIIKVTLARTWFYPHFSEFVILSIFALTWPLNQLTFLEILF